MNYLIEGLQGSGKSTLVRKVSEKRPSYKVITEGEYSPIELAWCAYMDEGRYREVLDRYQLLKKEIEEKTFSEGDKKIVCYTKIMTDDHSFYQDLEKNEIYNGRISDEQFRSIVLGRYSAWNGNDTVFECSLLQNTVEDMILFKCKSDEEILDFYRQVREALEGKDYRILYLKAEDLKGNLDVIRKERSDDAGNELWFPMMMGFFNNCPFAKKNNVSGEEALLSHLAHRMELELRICREIFPDRTTVLVSKKYTDEDVDRALI